MSKNYQTFGRTVQTGSASHCEICPGSLHHSVQTGNSKCVRYRLSQGDDVDEMVNGTSSLYQAVRNGHAEIVDILVENDANLELKTEKWCINCTGWCRKFLIQVGTGFWLKHQILKCFEVFLGSIRSHFAGHFEGHFRVISGLFHNEIFRNSYHPTSRMIARKSSIFGLARLF